MITEIGRIVALHNHRALVESSQSSTCGSCSARSGCGQGLLHRYLTGFSKVDADIPDTLMDRLEVGQTVEIGIPEGALLTASLMTYGLPISLLVLFCVVGESLTPNVFIIWPILGLLVGFLTVRFLLRRFFLPAHFSPVVTRLVPSPEVNAVDLRLQQHE